MTSGTDSQIFKLNHSIWPFDTQPEVSLVRLAFAREVNVERLACWIALLAMAGSPAWAKVVVAWRLASPPPPVEAGQQFTLCAANVGTARVDIELQFISVKTGIVAARREFTLPPPGAGGMPDPCLTTTAEVLKTAGNPPPGVQALVVAVVVVKRGVFSRPAAATSSVQVTIEDPAGVRRILASIPLQMATMINNRNTPIEIIH